MALLERVRQEGVAAEVERPAPEKVLAGDPVHTTWSLEERVDHLFRDVAVDAGNVSGVL